MSIESLTNLAPNVAIVAIFVFYNNKRDVLFQEIIKDLGSRLDNLAKVIGSLERRIAGVEKTRLEEEKGK